MARRYLSPHDAPRLARILATTVLTLVAASAFAGAARADISWRGNYETGSFSQWLADGGLQALQGPATIVGNHVREGRYGARFEVRPHTDPNSSGGERSEVLTGTGEHAGVESWWAWSTYFGDDFNPNPNTHWNIVTQWHHTGNSGQSNAHFEVNTKYAPWKIQLRTFGGQQDQNQRVFLLSDFKRNAWVDFVFHVRWARDNTGFVEAWVDGENVLPLTHTPTIYENQGVYLKQGLYRGASSVTSVVYHDGMRRGSSFADVATPGAGIGAGGVILRRPTIAPGRKVHVLAKTRPRAAVEVIVRGPYGSLLGSKRLRVSAFGSLNAKVYLPRWLRQRRLVVSVRAVFPDGVRRATRTIRVSKRELRAARTG